jgi:rubredoxin
MKNQSRAELLPAFLWTCPSCGRDSFERTIVAELSPEEMHELREDCGVEVWQQGHFLRAPASVKCPHCSESFETEEM